ncbi:MAG: D-alanyl-D-alanine carboxypeptidase [Verrucomicrobiales bacterium]|jgi:D-alanyl-D-alanine carboxypeptidase
MNNRSRGRTTTSFPALAAAVLLLVSCEKTTPTVKTPALSKDMWWSYPDTIEIVVPGNDPLTLRVDKGHQLPADYVPPRLTVIDASVIATNKEIQVMEDLIGPLRKLNAQAVIDGVDLSVISGYRSFDYQEKTYSGWINSNSGDRHAADKISARPGHSEHQLGSTIDFSTAEINHGIGGRFHRTRACAWLLANAPKFGFRLSYPEGKERETRYSHEGWHWRFWVDSASALQ